MTNYGISQRAYPTLDIAGLTLSEAQALYRRDYWQPLRGDPLPTDLDLLLFDCAINQGPATAIKLLQRLLKLKEDGLVGHGAHHPVTVMSPWPVFPEARAS